MRIDFEKYDLYNPEFKIMFIETYEENTQQFLAFTFKKAAEVEFNLGKDIYELNREEFNDLFKNFNAKSKIAIAQKISIIRKYIDFAIEQGRPVLSGINIVGNFMGEDYYDLFVSKTALDNKFITNQADLDDMIEFCANAQDACMIKLTTIGVTVEEIQNLRTEDCHRVSNTLDLRNDKDEIIRTLEIDEKAMNLVFDAINQERYENNNGEPSPTSRIKSFPLKQTGYVFRATKRSKDIKIPRALIARRLGNIFTLLDYPFLNITNLWWSGVVLYAKKLKEESGKTELVREDYIKINEHFRYGETGEVYWYQTKQKIEDYL
jgi:GTP:adenosylcobinamide-phosphate guanylyltransferase